ncbi:hypothetical protein B0H16DRAFT_1749580 [Mycena metata]|uniref:F-box domain-containing protein n=1 Tax=Mycena metata TaxID=1033252 RepID=A0AAD7DTJ8_9AGAR|nr:hypothetical protein B0H16DRAFT_1749580 [Mycena metata]
MTSTELSVLSACSFLLPPELVSIIFGHFAALHDPTLLSFRWACCRVSLVCRLWRAIANSEPAFWRVLSVGPATTSDLLTAFLHYSRHRSIAVSFSVFKPSPVRWQVVRPLLLASAHLLLPSVPRWIALELFIDDIPTMDAIISLLSTLPPPCLRFLACTCNGFDINPVGRLFIPKALVFAGQFPGLRTLTFKSVDVAWSTISPMPFLTDLTLHSCSWPKATVFAAILQSSPQLRSLSLSGVGVPGGMPDDPIVLPRLTTLRLAFDPGHFFSHNALYPFLIGIRLPMLSDLTLKFAGAGSVESFLDSAVTFSSASVRLEGSCGRADRMAAVYARLSSVTTLDLRRAHPNMLLALRLSVQDHNAVALAELTSLLLYSPAWKSVLPVSGFSFLSSMSLLLERPQAASLFSLLPLELCIMIFDLVLHPGQAQLRIRHKVCRASSQWLRFLQQHGRYWNRVYVDFRFPRELILRYIKLAGTVPLHFHISLKSSDPVVNLAYLAPHVAGATHFTVETDNDDTMQQLYDTFKGISGPNLRFFAVFFRSPHRRFRVPVDYTPLLPRPWFGDAALAANNTQSIQVLHLCCAVIPFTHLVFPNLRVLRLWGVHPGYSLDVQSLHAVITNSPRLTDVTLRRFSCTGLRAPNLPLIHSSTVRSLELGFASDGSISLLAALFVFPELLDLTVEISSEAHMEQLLNVPPPLLSRVGKLLIRNPLRYARAFHFPADQLFVLFPGLTILDIQHSRSWVFRNLLRDAQVFVTANGRNLIPQLRQLYMGYAPVEDIFRFANLYCSDSPSGVVVSLDTLHAGFLERQSFDVSTSADHSRLQWLRDNIANFSFELVVSPFV